MKVIPAIDLLNGQVVRLHKGDYDEATIYNTNPLEEAEKFKQAGFSHIHVVDLNGAKEGRFVNLDHIQRMVTDLDLSVQTGGGIRSYDDAIRLLDHGISQVICSSMAVKNTEDWLKLISINPASAILGMDLKDGKVAYSGWMKTAEGTIADFLKPMLKAGLTTILSTDISRDGTLEGPNIELYRSLKEQFPKIDIIASGGVSNASDLKTLSEIDVYGVVVGRAYYEQKLTLQEMQAYHLSS